MEKVPARSVLLDWQLKAAESSICQHLEINLPAGTTGQELCGNHCLRDQFKAIKSVVHIFQKIAPLLE
jgi:hypothetical protein